MRQQEEKQNLELELLRQKILTGLNQLNRGEYSNRTIKKIIPDSKKKIAAKGRGIR